MSRNQPQHGRGRQGDQYDQQPTETGMYGGGTGGHQRGRGMTDQQPAGQQSGGQRLDSHQRGGRTGTGGPQTNAMGMTGSMQEQHQQSGTGGGSQPHSFDDHMTDELWIALEDFSELSHVAAWCATQCATGDPELGICARVCQDLAEIAALNEMLITRDSMFGPELAATFMRVAADGVSTLRRYQQRHPHVLETVATIERTMNSCESLLEQVGRGTQTGGQQRGTQMSGQQRGTQTGGQQSGTQTGGQRGQSATGAPRDQHTQGMREQGQYEQGMSGQPTSRGETTGRQY